MWLFYVASHFYPYSDAITYVFDWIKVPPHRYCSSILHQIFCLCHKNIAGLSNWRSMILGYHTGLLMLSCVSSCGSRLSYDNAFRLVFDSWKNRLPKSNQYWRKNSGRQDPNQLPWRKGGIWGGWEGRRWKIAPTQWVIREVSRIWLRLYT